MNIDQNEAKEQLDLIRQAQQAGIEAGGQEAGWFLIIWGVVWLVGFLAAQFGETSWLPWVWFGLCLLGSAISAVVGLRLGQKVQYTQTGPQLGLFYPVLFGFSLLWLYLAAPTSWQQTAVLATSFIAFAVVVNGVLLRKRPFIITGFIGAFMAVAVYLWLLPWFGLVIGLVGGGGMLLSGLRLSIAR
ncbi:MAG: hypothetical protein AAF614_07755 [Chloroflexota bacterium]